MKILVTGGTGYIGSHTVVELQQKGYDVIIVDNLSNSYADVIYSIEKITGILPDFEKFDLCDYNKTADFFKKHKDIDAVIHFAAFKSVKESVINPLKYYNNNLISLINILKCMKENAINNIVFSSSCTVYGQAKILPVTENTPIQKPASPYGNTKQISEEIIADTVKYSDIKAISLRYFNPIGAHKSSLIGEYPLNKPNNLVPVITQTAIGKRKYFNVFGNDYNTPDKTCIRDYIHVVDTAKAHISAINNLINNKNNLNYQPFNLGTGKGYSVLEIIKTFEKISGIKLNYKIAKRRHGDIEQIWADPKFASEKLNWKTERNLEEMILSAWNWEKHLQKLN